MSWKSGIDERLIYDYEIGLSSTKDSEAPDIFPFKSTKHHSHFRFNNPDLDEGKVFYIVLKAITKADVYKIQVGFTLNTTAISDSIIRKLMKEKFFYIVIKAITKADVYEKEVGFSLMILFRLLYM